MPRRGVRALSHFCFLTFQRESKGGVFFVSWYLYFLADGVCLDPFWDPSPVSRTHFLKIGVVCPHVRESRAKRVNPFRTAVPFWGQTTLILSKLSPKRDCGPKRASIKHGRRRDMPTHLNSTHVLRSGFTYTTGSIQNAECII